ERFARNEWPTLGVEIELQLVDARSMALRSSIADVLAALPPGLGGSVKPEFMQCYVEINSDVGTTVDDVGADLARKVRAVERAAAAVRRLGRLRRAGRGDGRLRLHRVEPRAVVGRAPQPRDRHHRDPDLRHAPRPGGRPGAGGDGAMPRPRPLAADRSRRGGP